MLILVITKHRDIPAEYKFPALVPPQKTQTQKLQDVNNSYFLKENLYFRTKTSCTPLELLVCTNLQKSCTVSASLAGVSGALV